MLYEFAHMFLGMLNDMAKVSADAKMKLETVNDWLGSTGEYVGVKL